MVYAKFSLRKEITKSHQRTMRCHSSRLSRRYSRKWSWLSLRLISTNKHKLLSSHQGGNRKFHSTETINIAVTDYFLEAMDAKEISILILLDLSKAFDSVHHNILLRKISHLGASPLGYSWCASYLSERSQYVRIRYCCFIKAAINNTWNTPRLHFVTSFGYDLYQRFTIYSKDLQIGVLYRCP